MPQPPITAAEEQLDHLDVLLRQLKQQYDIFFAGAAPRQPFETRKEVEGLVEKMGRARMQRFSDRYRYNMLAGKFQTYRELWSKLLRVREEGYRPGSLRSAGISQAAPPPEGEPKSREQAHRTVYKSHFRDPTSEDDAFKNFYDRYVEARQGSGSGSEVSYSTFLKLIAQKTESIKERSGCDQVSYSIVLKEGAVTLKAAPVGKKEK
jgi:hypothetical protein